MITQLAKYYSMPPARAEKMGEMDFWAMREFETLDQQRTEYLMKQKFNKE
ncbi:MAG TPA: hypothetical protein VG961_10440 [Ignavibacteria bacterium]|nr:hypothetical protein [Ignavibacteria bacterium]